jgi:hypothetical protein
MTKALDGLLAEMDSRPGFARGLRRGKYKLDTKEGKF